MNKSSSDRRGGVAPFGYKWVGGNLVTDAAEASVRKMIFDLFVKHRRKKTVARELNERGFRTRNGSQFSDTTVGRLLSDPIVLGVEPGDDEEYIEPLVDRHIWDTTQSLLGVRPRKQRHRLFTGLAYCDCGGRMLISSGSSKYACTVCGRRIAESDVEEIFHAKLGDESLFEDRDLFDLWDEFTIADRRLLIEHILHRAIIGKETITLELGCVWRMDSVSDDPETRSGNAQSSNEPLMSEADASRFLGVSKMTLLRRRHAGQISFFRVGSRVLYSKQKHLIPFLEGNQNRGL